MVHRTSQSASTVIGQDAAESAAPKHYTIGDIVKCMRHSALMLWVADHDDRRFRELNQSQAKLLEAAANDLDARAGEA